MEKQKFAEIVIHEIHSKTISGELKWEDHQRSVSAQPIPAISVSIYYLDEGPDTAIWDYAMIGHPVGEDITMIGNPASPKAHLYGIKAGGQMLDQLNEIFRRVLLDPRKAEFEAAIKQLHDVDPQ